MRHQALASRALCQVQGRSGGYWLSPLRQGNPLTRSSLRPRGRRPRRCSYGTLDGGCASTGRRGLCRGGCRKMKSLAGRLANAMGHTKEKRSLKVLGHPSERLKSRFKVLGTPSERLKSRLQVFRPPSERWLYHQSRQLGRKGPRPGKYLVFGSQSVGFR